MLNLQKIRKDIDLRFGYANRETPWHTLKPNCKYFKKSLIKAGLCQGVSAEPRAGISDGSTCKGNMNYTGSPPATLCSPRCSSANDCK